MHSEMPPAILSSNHHVVALYTINPEILNLFSVLHPTLASDLQCLFLILKVHWDLKPSYIAAVTRLDPGLSVPKAALPHRQTCKNQ